MPLKDWKNFFHNYTKTIDPNENIDRQEDLKINKVLNILHFACCIWSSQLYKNKNETSQQKQKKEFFFTRLKQSAKEKLFGKFRAYLKGILPFVPELRDLSIKRNCLPKNLP